jgi:molecular chaperone DnaK (HSP70)
MRTLPPTVVVDLGPTSAAAIVVTDQGSWLVPHPASGESRWPCAIHWDGQQVDARRFRPAEQAAELFAAIRTQAQRNYGPINRAVVTVPTSVPLTDPRRRHLVGAAEAAGFTAVELLVEAAGAVWAPGSPLGVGDVALVYDLGATFEAAVIRVGDDLPEIIGHASLVDWSADECAAGTLSTAAIELTMACCRDLLARLALGRDQVDWVLPVGSGARTPGLEAALERGLGIPIAAADEPELAVVRGAAQWLPRSGPRSVMARPAPHRMVPLVFTIPGGSAQLLRWLVEPMQAYDAGAPVARVRLASGAVWDLTARTRGTLDEVLVGGGRPISTGDWLALVRPM